MDKREKISAWFNDYNNDVYNFLVYYRGTRDVQDLVQEVFIKAAKGLDSFRHDAEPKTWLFSIARNVAIDHARRGARRITPIGEPIDTDYVDDTARGPEDILLENEALHELYRNIRALKDNYAEIIILRKIEELSVRETAEILGCKESKVKVTYHRAKQALELLLSKERGDDS